MGPDVHISSATNETDHATGETASGTAQRTLRWLVLEYEEGTLTLQAPAPFTVAAKEAGPVTWDGKATLTPRSGVLTARDATYAAEGERAEIDGRFSASLTPAKDRAHMVLDGDLRSTTLAATTRTPAPGGPLGPSWVALLLIGAVVVGISGGAVGVWAFLTHRHAASEYPLTVEDCQAAADDAAQAEDYPSALEWYGRARMMAPTSAKLAAQEAFCLAKMGDEAAALERYAEADRLSPYGGDAAISAARLLHERGAPLEKVAPFLKAALEKTPDLLLDVEHDFPEVATRPEWVPFLERTRRRLEREWRGGPEP
jgi:tetratricopeptide (TPR) repeat protein